VGADGDFGAALLVGADHVGEVHAVQVIAGKDQVVVGLEPCEVPQPAAHRIGRALEPVRVVGCLLGREDLDESLREEVEPVGLRDVPVEGSRVELRQHEDAAQFDVEAVADGHIDQPVLAADGHGRLRALVVRERAANPDRRRG